MLILVFHLSSNFLFSTFMEAYRIAFGCAGIFFLFTARPLLLVVRPVSKDSGEAVWHFTGFSAPAQQESCQCHSYSDCRPHQTAHMLKVRQCKSASNHCCWDQAGMRGNWLYSNHGHLKHWRWETAPRRCADIVGLDQLGCDIFLVLEEMKSRSLTVFFYWQYLCNCCMTIHSHTNVRICRMHILKKNIHLL